MMFERKTQATNFFCEQNLNVKQDEKARGQKRKDSQINPIYFHMSLHDKHLQSVYMTDISSSIWVSYNVYC